MLCNREGSGARIVASAHQLGFDLVGCVPVYPPKSVDVYCAWLEKGYHGEMAYLARPEAVARRGDLSLLLPAVRSVVTVGINYHTPPLPAGVEADPARGIVAGYARGSDYHDLLAGRLEELAVVIADLAGGQVAWRGYVDTGPLLERELAVEAGLGFVGRNTNLIHPGLGSWLFLGELLVSVPLPAIKPVIRSGTCGRCRRCLDACPTGALLAPYVLDARRCLSYLTIELKGPIPVELRPPLGNRIFGCDICQQVCPWNRRFARPTAEPAFQPRPDGSAPFLLALLALDEERFRQRFRTSPLRRAKRRGLLRNVAVALGNWGDPAAVPALRLALGDPEPLIRGHAAWALGRIASREAMQGLARAWQSETDVWVRSELREALG